MKSITIRVMKADTRSLDYGACKNDLVEGFRAHWTTAI